MHINYTLVRLWPLLLEVPAVLVEMFTFVVTAALLFLSGRAAILPDVGKCEFMQYFCDARKCDTDFYKKLQKDPNSDCRAMFVEVVDCVKSTLKICMEGTQIDNNAIDAALQQGGFSENTVCTAGSLEVPTIPPALASSFPCSGDFSDEANKCVQTYHQKFAMNKSDPSLCEENAKAKKCVKNLLVHNCTFPSVIHQIFDLGLSDYNPFCANNRDPGATGNEQCHGVKPVKYSSGAAAAAGYKSSVPQALLFPLLVCLAVIKSFTFTF